MAVNKVVASAAEALDRARIPDGATLMMGGFGLCGIPEHLILELRRRGPRISPSSATTRGSRTSHRVAPAGRTGAEDDLSYVGENGLFERLYLTGELELEFVPQGTLAERIRAGGAGIPAFYTPTGAGPSWRRQGGPLVRWS